MTIKGFWEQKTCFQRQCARVTSACVVVDRQTKNWLLLSSQLQGPVVSKVEGQQKRNTLDNDSKKRHYLVLYSSSQQSSSKFVQAPCGLNCWVVVCSGFVFFFFLPFALMQENISTPSIPSVHPLKAVLKTQPVAQPPMQIQCGRARSHDTRPSSRKSAIPVPLV